jgi:hypothetical protein
LRKLSKFKDWEGQPMELRSEQIKDGAFSHAYEAGRSTENDLVPCPVQTNPDFHQRKDCSLITDDVVDKYANKMQYLAQSTFPDMVKFKLPMAYREDQ